MPKKNTALLKRNSKLSPPVFTSIVTMSEGRIAAKDWFADFAESLNDRFAIADNDSVLVHVNSNFCELLGHKQSEIIGRHVEKFLDQKNAIAHRSRRKKRQKGDATPYELSWKNNGDLRPTRVSPTPLFDHSGRFIGTFAIVTDISQEKAKERDLAEAQAELKQLVEEQTTEIARKNIALQELLRQIELEKQQYANTVTSNIETILLPMIKAAKGASHSFEKKVFDALERQILKLTSPLEGKLSTATANLTPREIQICNLIRNGFTGKEIAELLHVSPGTIDVHRNKIRKKLGLVSSKKNLAIALRSL